ncbi:hypothetical protein HDU93_006845 [Gonapodya sp. JEL0774]|nr:hypothetical protein HDU93_006845 [Gonapodya sp. JEL0774]
MSNHHYHHRNPSANADLAWNASLSETVDKLFGGALSDAASSSSTSSHASASARLQTSEFSHPAQLPSSTTSPHEGSQKLYLQSPHSQSQSPHSDESDSSGAAAARNMDDEISFVDESYAQPPDGSEQQDDTQDYPLIHRRLQSSFSDNSSINHPTSSSSGTIPFPGYGPTPPSFAHSVNLSQIRSNFGSPGGPRPSWGNSGPSGPGAGGAIFAPSRAGSTAGPPNPPHALPLPTAVTSSPGPNGTSSGSNSTRWNSTESVGVDWMSGAGGLAGGNVTHPSDHLDKSHLNALSPASPQSYQTASDYVHHHPSRKPPLAPSTSTAVFQPPSTTSGHQSRHTTTITTFIDDSGGISGSTTTTTITFDDSGAKVTAQELQGTGDPKGSGGLVLGIGTSAVLPAILGKPGTHHSTSVPTTPTSGAGANSTSANAQSWHAAYETAKSVSGVAAAAQHAAFVQQQHQQQYAQQQQYGQQVGQQQQGTMPGSYEGPAHGTGLPEAADVGSPVLVPGWGGPGHAQQQQSQQQLYQQSQQQKQGYTAFESPATFLSIMQSPSSITHHSPVALQPQQPQQPQQTQSFAPPPTPLSVHLFHRTSTSLAHLAHPSQLPQLVREIQLIARSQAAAPEDAEYLDQLLTYAGYYSGAGPEQMKQRLDVAERALRGQGVTVGVEEGSPQLVQGQQQKQQQQPSNSDGMLPPRSPTPMSVSQRRASGGPGRTGSGTHHMQSHQQPNQYSGTTGTGYHPYAPSHPRRSSIARDAVNSSASGPPLTRSGRGKWGSQYHSPTAVTPSPTALTTTARSPIDATLNGDGSSASSSSVASPAGAPWSASTSGGSTPATPSGQRNGTPASTAGLVTTLSSESLRYLRLFLEECRGAMGPGSGGQLMVLPARQNQHVVKGLERLQARLKIWDDEGVIEPVLGQVGFHGDLSTETFLAWWDSMISSLEHQARMQDGGPTATPPSQSHSPAFGLGPNANTPGIGHQQTPISQDSGEDEMVVVKNEVEPRTGGQAQMQDRKGVARPTPPDSTSSGSLMDYQLMQQAQIVQLQPIDLRTAVPKEVQDALWGLVAVVRKGAANEEQERKEGERDRRMKGGGHESDWKRAVREGVARAERDLGMGAGWYMDIVSRSGLLSSTEPSSILASRTCTLVAQLLPVPYVLLRRTFMSLYLFLTELKANNVGLESKKIDNMVQGQVAYHHAVLSRQALGGSFRSCVSWDSANVGQLYFEISESADPPRSVDVAELTQDIFGFVSVDPGPGVQEAASGIVAAPMMLEMSVPKVDQVNTVADGLLLVEYLRCTNYSNRIRKAASVISTAVEIQEIFRRPFAVEMRDLKDKLQRLEKRGIAIEAFTVEKTLDALDLLKSWRIRTVSILELMSKLSDFCECIRAAPTSLAPERQSELLATFVAGLRTQIDPLQDSELCATFEDYVTRRFHFDASNGTFDGGWTLNMFAAALSYFVGMLTQQNKAVVATPQTPGEGSGQGGARGQGGEENFQQVGGSWEREGALGDEGMDD